jgi:hypothetical protein
MTSFRPWAEITPETRHWHIVKCLSKSIKMVAYVKLCSIFYFACSRVFYCVKLYEIYMIKNQNNYSINSSKIIYEASNVNLVGNNIITWKVAEMRWLSESGQHVNNYTYEVDKT